MKTLMLSLILILSTRSLLPTKIIPLTDVFNPDSILVTDNEIYISAFPYIYIYSPKDFKLIKKIGTKGEGPQEFRRFTLLSVRPEYLFVSDRNKVSYFTRDGNYLKEMNSKSIINWGVKPLSEGFVGKSRISENNIQFDTLNLYDSNLNKVKEVCKYKFFYQASCGGKKCDAAEIRGIQFQVSDDKIFYKTSEELVIDMFDKSGNKIKRIKHDYKRIKFSERHQNRFRDYFKTTHQWKRMYDAQIKQEITFPANLPAIQTFIAADKKLYILTYETKEKKSKFVILDFNGTLINELFVPFDQSEYWFHYSLSKALRYNSPTPTFSINNGKLYQLVEEQEENIWALHITAIE
jgi:hypothetical protein